MSDQTLNAEQIEESRAWLLADSDKEIAERVNALCDMALRSLSAQAEIDRLMLEYCPDEITEQQKEEWAKNQRSLPSPDKPGEAQDPHDELIFDGQLDQGEPSSAVREVEALYGDWSIQHLYDNKALDLAKRLDEATHYWTLWYDECIESDARLRSAESALKRARELLREVIKYIHACWPKYDQDLKERIQRELERTGGGT